MICVHLTFVSTFWNSCVVPGNALYSYSSPQRNSHIKRMVVFVIIPFRGKKQFCFLLGRSVSKGAERELLLYPFRVALKKYDATECVVLELVSLWV